MSEEKPEPVLNYIHGHPVRSTRIEGTDYVAMNDFADYIRALVEKIVSLSNRQQEHISVMSTTLDVMLDVLSEKYPEIKRELMQIADRRIRPV
jgi:hypothetical protein